MKLLDLSSLPKLPARKVEASKWDFGHVAVVAGDEGMPGAAALSSYAALASGAGLVSLYTHPSHAKYATSMHPEIMCHEVKDGSALKKMLTRATVIVVGPGMGDYPWSREMIKAVVELNLPMVMDAGALDYLHEFKPVGSFVITPHEVEASRLLKVSPEEIHSDRTAAVKDLAQKFNCIALLKGHETLISNKTEVFKCPYGTSVMATAGMGDVLSGIIAGLIAQGMTLLDAVNLAVCAHAKAGELAQDMIKGPSVLATELLDCVRPLLFDQA